MLGEESMDPVLHHRQDGHLLYRFSGDHETGDINGEGKHGPQNGTWHVATPGL
jgi:predicted lipoprotein with Yx(FWY)xxD motif